MFYETDYNKMNEGTVCPGCNGDEAIRRATIEPVDADVYICGQCGSFWLRSEEISVEKFHVLMSIFKD